MNITYKYLLSVCTTAYLILVGCTNEVRFDRDDGNGNVTEENYLSLTVSCSSAHTPTLPAAKTVTAMNRARITKHVSTT